MSKSSVDYATGENKCRTPFTHHIALKSAKPMFEASASGQGKHYASCKSELAWCTMAPWSKSLASIDKPCG